MNEELRIKITAEIDQLKKEVSSAKQQIETFTKKSDKNFKGFGEVMKKAGAVGKGALKVVATSVAALGAAIVGLSESTEEYRTNQAKLETAFEAAGSSAETATQTYNDLYRVLGDDDVAVEAAGHLAQLTTNQADLSEWTNICQGVYATFGDSLPIESLTEAANETAKTGEVTGALADALNWAGIKEDDFAESLFWCNSEAEREALIRETLNGQYSEAAAAYEENAKQVLAANEAQAKLNEALGTLGEVVTPIATLLKTALADTLASLTPQLELVASGLDDITNGIEGGAEKLGEGLTNILLSLVDRIVELAPKIIDLIIDIIPQITGAILGALPSILEAAIKIVVKVIEGIAEVLPTVVDQIVAIIPVLIQTLIDNIPALLNAAITLLMAIVDAIPVIIVNLVDALPDLIDSLLDTLLANLPVLLDAAITLLMAIVDAIPKIIPPIVKALPRIISSIVDALINATPTLIQGGIQMFMALVQSIPKVVPELIRGLGTMVKAIKDNLIEKIKKLLSFKWKWPKVKMPSLSVTWKNSPAWLAEAAKLVGLQGVPSFKLNWNAMGGVFDKPTVFGYGGSLQGIGENGAEAVVPLENNLGWLDKLATMLSERLGSSSTPIVLQVDGKTFAKTAVSSINSLTRQQGKLSLNLV